MPFRRFPALTALAALTAAALTQAQNPPSTPTPDAMDGELAPAAAPHADSPLTQRLPPAQIQWLSAAGEPFLALYIEEYSGTPQGAALILPAAGKHPAWPETIDALRRSLPDNRWHSLAISMPQRRPERPPPRTLPSRDGTAPADSAGQAQDLADASGDAVSATPSDSPQQARIAAALAFLNQQGIFNTVVIAEGSSATEMLDYIRQHNDPNADNAKKSVVQALVMIDAHNRLRNRNIDVPAIIPKLTMPTLDLYTRRDRHQQQQAAQRKAASQRLPPQRYTQTALPPSRPGRTVDEDHITRRIRGWMEQNAAGTKLDKRLLDGDRR